MLSINLGLKKRMLMGLHQPKQGFHHLTIRNGTCPKDLPYKNLVSGVFHVQNYDLQWWVIHASYGFMVNINGEFIGLHYTTVLW
jgi:hypothetical protein